jgi:hypothetical protein
MNRSRPRITFAVLAIIVLACGQPSSQTEDAGPASVAGSNAAPTPVPSVGPSASSTSQGAAAVPQPPTEFTGSIICGPPVSGDRAGDVTTVDVDGTLTLTRQRGGAWRQTVTMTDERLEGEIVHTWESDGYATVGADPGPSVSATTWRIVNPGGSWEHRGFEASYADGTVIGDPVMAFVGSGGYAGLVGLMEVTAEIPSCGIEVKGVIFDGAPIPEPYIAP